jgi:DNA (cytosine-5)-methyltransferase 1
MLLKERRKKKWAEIIGIDWMDGMPLTADQIRTFFDTEDLQELLDDLVEKGYLVLEHPKKRVKTQTSTRTRVVYERVPDASKPKGYNIVTGKLSFEFSRILCPEATTPTLVAMDMETIGVIDNGGLRNLTLNEGLRLFGYPESYSLDGFNTTKKGICQGFDLLGNTVCVPVIKAIAERLAISQQNFIDGGKA